MSLKPTAFSPRYEALVQLLRTSNALWDASRVFFDQWALSPSQFNVLNLLHTAPDGMSQTNLGRRLLTHRSNVTGLIDRLEKRGLVARKEAADRRAYQVVITPQGITLLKKVLPQYHRAAEQVWDGVSDDRIAGLLSALEHVTQNSAQVVEQMPGKRPSQVP